MEDSKLIEWLVGIVSMIVLAVAGVTYRKADSADQRSKQTDSDLKYLRRDTDANKVELSEIRKVINKLPLWFERTDNRIGTIEDIMANLESYVLRRQKRKIKPTIKDEDEEQGDLLG